MGLALIARFYLAKSFIANYSFGLFETLLIVKLAVINVNHLQTALNAFLTF